MSHLISSLFETVPLSLLTATQLRNTNKLNLDIIIDNGDSTNAQDLMKFIAFVHCDQRSYVSTLERRLEGGDRCYRLWKSGVPAAYLWMGLGASGVYPARIRIQLGTGVAYFFNVMTASRFRRQGLLGMLLHAAWEENQLRAACVCVRQDNVEGRVAHERLGFREEVALRFTRLGVLKFRSLGNRSGTLHVRQFSLATPWRKPKDFTIRVDGSGHVSLSP